MKKILVRIWLVIGAVSLISLICLLISDIKDLFLKYFYSVKYVKPTIYYDITFISIAGIFLLWLILGMIFSKKIAHDKNN